MGRHRTAGGTQNRARERQMTTAASAARSFDHQGPRFHKSSASGRFQKISFTNILWPECHIRNQDVNERREAGFLYGYSPPALIEDPIYMSGALRTTGTVLRIRQRL